LSNFNQIQFDNWIKPKLRNLLWGKIVKKEGSKLSFKTKGINCEFEIENEFLTAYIIITNEYYKGLGIAKKAFSDAINHFGKDNIRGIKGFWLKSKKIGDNFEAFMKVYNGKNFEEAAFKHSYR
jgi:hypothetical protein